jgi:HSP20 family molecular chaperone IbpA
MRLINLINNDKYLKPESILTLKNKEYQVLMIMPGVIEESIEITFQNVELQDVGATVMKVSAKKEAFETDANIKKLNVLNEDIDLKEREYEAAYMLEKNSDYENMKHCYIKETGVLKVQIPYIEGMEVENDFLMLDEEQKTLVYDINIEFLTSMQVKMDVNEFESTLGSHNTGYETLTISKDDKFDIENDFYGDDHCVLLNELIVSKCDMGTFKYRHTAVMRVFRDEEAYDLAFSFNTRYRKVDLQCQITKIGKVQVICFYKENHLREGNYVVDLRGVDKNEVVTVMPQRFDYSFSSSG